MERLCDVMVQCDWSDAMDAVMPSIHGITSMLHRVAKIEQTTAMALQGHHNYSPSSNKKYAILGNLKKPLPHGHS